MPPIRTPILNDASIELYKLTVCIHDAVTMNRKSPITVILTTPVLAVNLTFLGKQSWHCSDVIRRRIETCEIIFSLGKYFFRKKYFPSEELKYTLSN
jgi:hypothetical protein